MKRKALKHRKTLIYAVLAFIIGATGGFLWGYHQGVAYAPPILLMSGHHYPLTIASYRAGLISQTSL